MQSSQTYNRSEIDELQALFRAAQESTAALYEQELILIIGNSGTGKSTCINYMLEHPLEMVTNTRNGGRELKLADPDAPGAAPIGRLLGGSETLFPAAYRRTDVNPLIFCDTGGFPDTRGGCTTIAIHYAIRSAVTTARRIKAVIIMCTEAQIFDADKGATIVFEKIKAVKELLGPDVEGYQSSVFLIFNKVRDRDLEQLRNTLSDVVADLLNVDEERDRRPSASEIEIANLLSFIRPENILIINPADQGESRPFITENLMRSPGINGNYRQHVAASWLWESLYNYNVSSEICLQAWNFQFIAEERDILASLTEQLMQTGAMQRSVFEDYLLELIRKSCRTPTNAKAASNAITLLNKARFDFSALRNRDLSYIHIPQADLSEALMSHVNLSHSDLSRVYFHNAILVGSNLSYATLTGARFSACHGLVLNQEVVTFAFQPGSVDRVAYNQNHDIIFSSLFEDVAEQRLSGHTSNIYSIAFSSTGFLASGSDDKTVRIWDITQLSSDSCINIFSEHTAEVYSVAWSPTGLLASGGKDTVIRIWNREKALHEACIQLCRGHEKSIESLMWSPTELLASGGDDQTIRIWNVSLPSGAVCLHELRGHVDTIKSLSWSATGLLASGSLDKTIRIWDMTQSLSDVCVNTLRGHKSAVRGVSWSPTGERLASGSWDYTVRIWDLTYPSAQTCLHTFEGHHTDGVTNIVWPTSECFVSGGLDKTIRVWNITNSSEAAHLKEAEGHSDLVRAFTWSQTGLLASGSEDNTIRLWDTQSYSKTCLSILGGHAGSVYSVSWSLLSMGWLASGGTDKTVRIWDTTQASPLKFKLKGHTASIYSVSWSLTVEKLLASGSADNTVRIWDLKQRSQKDICRHILQGHTRPVHSVAWSAAGLLASGSVDNTICIWDVTKASHEAHLHRLTGHEKAVSSLSWSSTGALASGSSDKSIRIWDVKRTPQPVCEVTLQTPNEVNSITWSPDNAWLICATQKEHLFWKPNHWHDAQHKHRLPFGSMTIAIYGALLAFNRGNEVHVLRLTDFPQRYIWLMVFPCKLWLQGCDFTGAQGISFPNQRLLKTNEAIVQVSSASSISGNSSTLFGEPYVKQQHNSPHTEQTYSRK